MDYKGLKKFTARTWSGLEAGDEVTIVAFGDSITAGYAVRRGFTSFWKEMLAKKFPEAKIKMINQGISGETTHDGLSRLEWAVLTNSPDLTTVNFGINDAVFGLGLEEFKENFALIAERILAAHSEVLLLSSQPLETPPYDSMVLDYYHAIEDVAGEMGVGFVDVYGAWMERVLAGTPLGSLIIPGLDHPNEAGYRIIAEELMKFF
jgi:acyl-CoA thioesterase I